MTSPYAEAARRVIAGSSPHDEAEDLVRLMSREERLRCLDGDTPFWPGLLDMTSGGYYEHPWPAAVNERLGIPGITFSDGPRGVVVGNATCFPAAMARGAAFDPDLERRIGEAIGAELAASGANFTGAVCVNLLRHPAWGRAQETYGEDPHHVGVMGAALTVGLQQWVLACVKHFALNSMENARFRVDVAVGERALHEVYLPHFRRIVDAGVASVMSAYNSVNGEWCGESTMLLREVLRDEWGFDGFVVSDFIFGLRDAVRSVQAGLDIEMPFRQQRAMVLAEALADGRLSADDVDAACVRILATLLRFASVIGRDAPPSSVIASSAHRALAREAAQRSIVLLRNEGDLLPLDAQALRHVEVLGRLAAVANLGDGGSSNVHPPSVITPLDGIRAALETTATLVTHGSEVGADTAHADAVVVVVGYTKDDEGEYVDPSGTAEVLAAWPHLFPPMDHPELGVAASRPREPRAERPQPASMAPGGDRASLRLSASDEALIAAATAVNANVIVVVMAGSAVVAPWNETVRALMMLWYPGMEGGAALADVLLGAASPGGRLPFVIPAHDHDLVPFERDASTADYGLLHGQWWLDAHGRHAAYPFGFGLSYGSAEITGASVVEQGGTVVVRAELASLGAGGTAFRADELVLVLGRVSNSAYERPARRLVGFARCQVEPGGIASVDIPVELPSLDVRVDGEWVRESAVYELDVVRHCGEEGLTLLAPWPPAVGT